MTSRTSFFNRTVFGKTMRRYWPLWVVYLLIMLISTPLSLSRSQWQYGGISLITVQAFLYSHAMRVMPVMAFFMAPLSAMAVFSHLYNEKSCGTYGMLPVRREGMFCSVALAGLVPLIAANVLTAAVTLAVESNLGYVNWSATFVWLGISSLQVLAFYGFATLCAQLTGAVLVVPVVYAVLEFVAVVFESLVRQIIDVFVYGYEATRLIFEALSPMYYLNVATGVNLGYDELTGELVGCFIYGIPILVVYAVVGAAFLVMSLLLYRRRRMETAGDIVACAPMKPVFKYCMSFGAALCFGCLIFAIVFSNASTNHTNAFTTMMALLAVGSLIGYFAAQMLICKSFRVWKKGWLGFAVFTVLLLVLFSAFELDLFGYERRVPALAEVSSVTISETELSGEDNLREALRLHEQIISQKVRNERATEAREGENLYVTVDYKLTDGSRLSRRYELRYVDELVQTGDELQALLNTQEAIFSRAEMDIPVTEQSISWASVEFSGGVTRKEKSMDFAYKHSYAQQNLQLTRAEAYELYSTCIFPDMQDGTIGLVHLVNSEENLATFYDCNIHIEVERRAQAGKDYSYGYFYTTPTVNSVRTNEWLASHGVVLRLLSDVLE